MATFAVALTPTVAQAAPPSNDDFANAEVIAAPGIVTGTNVDATTELGEPVRHITDDDVDYDPTASVWYRWTSPDVASPPEMLISTRGSDFDTVVSVWTGGPGLADLTEVVADDDFDEAAGASRLRFQPTQDTEYYIAVDGCCNGDPLSTGAIRLRLSEISGQGSIDGFVTSDGTSGVDGFCVIAVDDTGEQISTTGYTDATGEYIVNSVEAGTDRHLKFWNCGRDTTYAGEFNGNAQTLGDAPDILVTNGQTLHIDAQVDPGGSISGTVSPDDSGSLSSLADICVRATMVGEPDDGFTVQTTTNASGQYTLVGLDGGDYRIRFGGDCAANGDFAVEYYDDAEDPADALLVEVTEGSAVGAVDAGLAAAPGAISGTVREWESGPGIPDICVRAVGPSYTSPTFETDANGEYTIPNVPVGTDHIVRFTDCHTGFDPLATQWYNRALTLAEADPITVTSGNTTPSIDASMFHLGELGGHVTDSAGDPRAGVCVDVYQSGGSLVRSTTTAVDGGWTVPVAPGNYHVYFGCEPDTDPFQHLWWHSRTSQAAADDVFVDQGDAVTDLDQLLPDDGLITGRVTNGGGAALPDICVTAYEDNTSDIAAQDFTDQYGFFDLGVAAGDYDVQYLDCDQQYQEQWYDGKPNQATADTITVPTQSTVRASATLARWGTISGLITDEANQPVTGICVTTYDANGDPLGNEIENRANGTYTVGGMGTGAYRVRFEDCAGSTYGTEFYDNKLDLPSATGVSVGLGGNTSGINVTLQSEAPSNVVLPGITGTAQVGVTLHADRGVWQHEPSSYTYEWYRCDDSGATCTPANGDGDSYFVSPGDLGQRIRVDVVATNSVGDTLASAPLTDVVGSGPPENDDFADRTVLTGSTPIHLVGTNVDATREPGEPAHDGFTIGASVWYEWTAPSGAGAVEMVQLDLSNSDYSTTTSVYEGSSPAFGDLTLVTQDNFATGATGVVDWQPEEGTTYYIAIDGYWDSSNSEPSEGSIDLRLSAVSGITGAVADSNGDPIRDICVTATGDSFGNSTFTAADGTFLLQLDPGNYIIDYHDCTGEFEDQWYDGAIVAEDATPVHVSAETVTPGIDATLTRLVDFGSISGTVTNEEGGPVPNICVYAWYDGGGYGGSTWTAQDGTYQIRGLGDPDNPDDALDYDIQFSDCSGFYGDENYDNKINGDADPVGVRLDQHVVGIDAVLQHDPPVSTAAPTIAGTARVGGVLRARDGAWDHEPSVFTFQWYRCESDGSGCVVADDGGDRRYLLTPEDEGYRFKVEVTAENSVGSSSAESDQTDVVDTGAPANDDIADRQELTGSLPITVTGNNVGATREVGEPDHLGFIDGASVWYEWTAPSIDLPDRVTISLAGSSFDTTLSIYDGTPTPFSGLHLVAENDEYNDETSIATFQPVADTTYYIAVDGYVDDITDAIDMGSIDLRLSTATGVAGVVVDEDSEPIRDVCVTATQDPEPLPDGPQVDTSADGTYFLELSPGTWYVNFYDCVEQYEEQWYDGQGDYTDATPIGVSDGIVTDDIDATMMEVEPFGSISGTVVNDDGEPIPDICVLAVDSTLTSYSQGCTDENGTYQVRGLGDPENPTTGLDYTVVFQDCGCFYGPEFYDNKLIPDDADLVDVMMEQHVTGIDAAMQSEAPVNTTLPSITGATGTVGQTLGATTGTWQHEPSVFAYQWLRCSSTGGSCVTITDATDSTYLTTSEDTGHRLRVDVTASNSIGDTTSRSFATAAVGAPVNVTLPIVTGQTTAGAVLTASPGTWSGAGITFSYQWLRCDSAATNCVPIVGAQATTYTLDNPDTAKRIRVEVTATNTDGSAAAKSFATAIIGAPTNATLPTITGQTDVGSQLTAGQGTWNGTGISYTYQWLRCDSAGTSCVPIGGAQSTTYTLDSADLAKRIRVEVTATNTDGSATARSFATAIIGAPTNVTLPTITGQTDVGSQLTAGQGTWNGSGISYTYQWLRCDSAASSCVPIDGAQSTTYTLDSADLAKRLRIEVTATNSNGSIAVRSFATVIVGVPSLSERPVISGTLAVGSTLAASTGAWGPAPSSYGYQWLRCDSNASNCTHIGTDQNTYQLTGADEGSRIRVRVTASNSNGGGTEPSFATAVVGTPSPNERPVISGTLTVGSTLTATTGTWEPTPSSFSYQWLRCDTDASNCTHIGTDQNTYQLTGADEGSRIRVRVTASNTTGGRTEQSFATATVGASG